VTEARYRVIAFAFELVGRALDGRCDALGAFHAAHF